MKGRDGCYIPASLNQLKLFTCLPFLPLHFSTGRETEAQLGQVASSFPGPSPKNSEVNWKDWELFQRGKGGTGKSWTFTSASQG